MTNKALIRRLQISCLGLDPIDPLRLLVDDVVEALREHALKEVQRLGQEIEQEPVVGITAIRTWFKDGRVVTQTLCNSWVDTAPPQRTWVGLTDEDKHEIELRAGITEDDDGYIVSQVFKLTEAKLKERNT
jgi:hypothetical protein